MEEKILLAKSSDLFKINLLKSKLVDAGIPCWILNKQDSSYQTFGEAGLYINATDQERAIQIVG